MSWNWAVTLQKQPKTFTAMKDESTVEHSTISKWFKKFCSGYKNIDNQAYLGKPKTLDSEAMLQAIVTL